MRILHVIQELAVGGAERMTLALAHGARRSGHQVAVAAASGVLAGELAGVPLFRLPLIGRRPHRLPLAVHAVRRALRSWSPHLVHCHNLGTAIAVALAMGWPRRQAALVTLEGFSQPGDARKNARVLRWLGMPAVACAPGIAAALRQHGLDVQTIANGVSPAPPPADRTRLEREWASLRGRRLLVAAGRLVPTKNLGLTIRALATIPDAALVVMGEGPMRAELEKEAAAAGVGDRVVLTGLRSDAREIIGAADAVIISSLLEGLPLVALEALAGGRPLIAARADWLEGVLTDGRDCLIVEPGDAELVSAAVRRVLDDGELATRLGEEARRVAAGHSEESTVGAYLELYRSLAS